MAWLPERGVLEGAQTPPRSLQSPVSILTQPPLPGLPRLQRFPPMGADGDISLDEAAGHLG